jgi:hypothetical protein
MEVLRGMKRSKYVFVQDGARWNHISRPPSIGRYTRFMRSTTVILAGMSLLALGCGDSTSPVLDTEGGRLATQFERLADSVDAGGYSPAGEALRHAADIVRLTGHATPVTVSIDGAERAFLAVAEQIDLPILMCSWPSDTSVAPPPDSVVVPPTDTVELPPIEPPEPPECTVDSSYSMRTLIAWEPDRMNEVVRLVAHTGSNPVATGVPDVMAGLPSVTISNPPETTPPDSGGGSGGTPGGWPGFMGEYLVRDVGSWMAFEGNQSNALEEITGNCTVPGATFDWAEFTCEAARLRFEFSMSVEPLDYERLTGVAGSPGGPEGRHTLAMRSSSVDGVRLTWESWTPPPLPPDTSVVHPPGTSNP